jgi:hypothetical protein
MRHSYEQGTCRRDAGGSGPVRRTKSDVLTAAKAGKRRR